MGRNVPLFDQVVLLVGIILVGAMSVYYGLMGFSYHKAPEGVRWLYFLGVYALLVEAYRLSRSAFVQESGPTERKDSLIPVLVVIVLGIACVLMVVFAPYNSTLPISIAIWSYYLPVILSGMMVIVATGLATRAETPAGRAIISLFMITTILIAMIYYSSLTNYYGGPSGQNLFLITFPLIATPPLAFCMVSEAVAPRWEKMGIVSRIGATIFTVVSIVGLTFVTVGAPMMFFGFT